ncbi:type VI secretion system baseplate subunit TssK [Luteimonas sp. SJ-92]|uniref:Type VI secretion system baseplate subunit TssK n=1 Tax=Luteimonas salinisoli TaxID=2752307 RepID=A0A853JGS1_9GAMM|nr:type VI secretion system baseplate subunit TssK [Luteimonas salinisoli]NZA28601.1 type VI secretion system baseplate subunit TssK [Luteimonas salinisoli]
MIGDRQVFWGQGAFLSPQHLQAQDAWHQALRQGVQRRVTPFPWGFEVLQLREDALGSGMVDIEKLVLFTRDGERLCGGSDLPAGNTRVQQRALQDLAPRDNAPIALWLVLNRERTVHGLGASGRLSERHLLASDSLEDPFDPQAPAADVDFLLYQPMIVTSLDENAEALVRSCEAYKFAEIVPAGPGKFKSSGDYVPPLLALQASPNLARWTRGLRDLLVSRGQDFAATKRQRGIRAASTSAQEAMRVVMMQTFARHIPVVQEHVRMGTVPAYALYQQLRALVAEFSVFSEDIGYFGGLASDPSGTELPDYDHDDLRRCFRVAFDRAEVLIKALTVGAEVGVALAYDGRFYKADLPASLFESDKTRFYLAFESELRGQDLFARLSRTGKIASQDEMPRLLSAALFGLKIDLLPVPPEELPQKTPNTTYFLVDTAHPFWQMIKNARNISVFCDLPPDATVIKLYPVGAGE